ncbi:C-GCAxxG-C-C family protein [Anaerovorax odorimutans]|uniref:C-GCAxxG-C-C family protein n=1 Tax=Anaerovorax odorimutans TaxID=109327 RepID=UPI0004139A2B|nr:C-GCAxxG-C-C family protein [Anaerovorax odorimutans]
MKEDIFDLKLKGYCCSQIIMELGLRKLDKENADLVAAMAGLCNGIWNGKTCGVLSAAVCLLYLADPYNASQNYVQDINEWFEDTFEATDCQVLLEGNELNKTQKCPMMIEATFTKVCEILEWD